MISQKVHNHLKFIFTIELANSTFSWPTYLQYLVGGLEHEFYFPKYIGNVIIPIGKLIFFRGVGSTTNQDPFGSIIIINHH